MTTQMPPPPKRNAARESERWQRASLELRRELARVERGLAPGESSAEREALLLALQRLDDGSYGYCEDCSREIAEERLDVMPATRWCVRCAR